MFGWCHPIIRSKTQSNICLSKGQNRCFYPNLVRSVSITPQDFPMQRFPGLLFLRLFIIIHPCIYTHTFHEFYSQPTFILPLFGSPSFQFRLVCEWGRKITWFPIFVFKPILKQLYLNTITRFYHDSQMYLACSKHFIPAK